MVNIDGLSLETRGTFLRVSTELYSMLCENQLSQKDYIDAVSRLSRMAAETEADASMLLSCILKITNTKPFDAFEELVNSLFDAGMQKIPAIKEIRNRTGLGLKESKELSEKFGHDWEVNRTL